MMDRDYRSSIIKALVRREEMIGQLYSVYAEKFAEQKDFWQKIAAEERKHAILFESLEPKVDLGSVVFERNRFDLVAINLSIAYVERRIEEAKNQPIAAEGALSIARDIENSWLEGEGLEPAKEDPADLRSVLSKLTTETKEHKNVLERLCAGADKGKKF